MSKQSYRHESEISQAPVPNNPEAEAALLGAMLIDNRVIDDAQGMLVAEDFYDPFHGHLFRLCVEQRSAGKLVNPVLLKPYLINDERIGRLLEDRQRTIEYIARLTGSSAALIGAHDFARQVADLAIMRRMAEAARTGADKLSAPGYDLDVASSAAEMASEIVESAERAQTVRVRSASDMLRRVARRQEDIRGGASLGVTCATIPELTDLMGPLGAGTYTIIAGRPSMGKSVLAQSLLLGCAANGHGSLLISQEMGEEALAMRLAADATHAMGEPLEYDLIRKGKLDPSELRTLEEAAVRIERLPLRMVSPEQASIEYLESVVAVEASRMARQGKRLEIVVLDYIQRTGSTKRFSSKLEELNYVSKRLLRLFKRHKLAGVVLSQLAREVEKRPDHRPQMSDLRESGSLEEDADNVLLVDRPEYWLKRAPVRENDKGYQDWLTDLDATRGRVDVIGAKTRAAEIGDRQIRFYGSSQAMRGRNWQDSWMGEGSRLL